MYRGGTEVIDSPEIALARAIEAVGTADFVPAAVDYARSIAPFVGVFLTNLKGNRPPRHVYDNVRAERRAEVVDRWLDGSYLLDPFFTAYRADPETRLMTLAEVAPDGFRQSTYFRRYYEAIHLQDEIGMLISLANGRTLFYSIGRRAKERRFTRREIGDLRRVLPVFAALNKSHFERGDYRPAEEETATSDGLGDAMERFGADTLTQREREIAGLILKGHTSNSIAHNIDISPGTVKIHRKNIYRKLQISSQSELFTMYINSL